VPTGNCKLRTLRQYYRPPERGAHMALGDVLTEIAALRRLLEMLQIKILEVLEATDELKESADYELYDLTQRTPRFSTS